MNDNIESKPTEDTLRNREAGDALARKAAMRGDPICGAYFELESFLQRDAVGRSILRGVEYDPEDWDDCRPY